MQINPAQFFFGRSQSESHSQKAVPVRSVSPNLNLAVGMLLSGRVAQSTAESLNIALNDGGFLELAGGSELADGDAVTARVATLKPQLQVTLFRTPQSGELHARDLGLSAGQTIAARVVGQLSPQQAIIEVNGQQIAVETSEALQNGSLLPVRIDEEAGRVFLTVLGGAAAVEVLARHYLSAQDRPRDALGKLLRSLLSTIQSVQGLGDGDELAAPDAKGGLGNGSLTPEESAFGNQLKQLLDELAPHEATSAETIERGIEDGGLLFESRLAKLLETAQDDGIESDLKAILLKLTNAAEQADDESPVAHLARQALSQLEQLQLANVLNQMHDHALVWQMPGWPGSSPVFLRIEPDDDTYTPDDDSLRPWQVLMALDLDDVGPVRIDARLQNRALRVLLFTEPNIVDRMTEQLSELQESLTGAEFDQILLAVYPIDRMPENLAIKLNQTVEAMPENWNAVDLEG